MINTLSSIYLRLDVDMQNLASKAMAQIIVKIMYSHEGGMSKSEIKSALTQINVGKSFNDEEIDCILKELAEKEINYRKGRYSLSHSQRDNIGKSIAESEQRRNNIIDKYFSSLNSSRSVIEDWLTEMSLKFFETFSDEWVSDLLSNTNHIVSSSDSIREQVINRTRSMNQIDKDDKEELPNRFFHFINSHDNEVDAYLWEYGISAFASKLIRNKHGVNKLTIDTFKDSFCILDTNVLLFIALENKYKGAFKAIEKVFEDLSVRTGILYITKREYENKVNTQKYETLSNFDSFGYEVTSMPDDDFTKMALDARCHDKEDFERFFDTTLSLPNSIYDRVRITLKDDDSKLRDVIDNAQTNQSLMDKLNDISIRICHHPKRESACRHDVGLIEGVRYLRDSEDPDFSKCFILSDDFSINQYSKSFGTKKNLPLSLRVDTLISMLAVNNGGDTFDASDYRPLFANIIRLGLSPRKDTFRQTELYQLSQMNRRVTTLPPEDVKNIAMEVHRKYLDGLKEEDIRRDLNEMITKGEINAKDAIKQSEENLEFERKQKEEFKAKSKKNRDNLENVIRSQVETEYDKRTKCKILLWWVLIFFVVSVIAVLAFCCYNTNTSDKSSLGGLILSLVGDFIFALFSSVKARRKVIFMRRKERERTIREEVERRLSDLDKS